MLPVPENRKISPSLVFFAISSVQIGVGALGFQRIIAKTAGYDAWISVIIAGLATNMILWFMYKIVELGKEDLGENHRYVYGKWIGGIFNTLFIFYFTTFIIIVLRTYIEIVQVWMFNDLNVFLFAMFFITLCIYIVRGGFRTVVGIAFFGVVVPSYLIILFGFTIPYSNFRHFLPILDHSAKDLIKASYQMSLTYMGYESFIIYYPFIKDKQKSKKWAHLALLSSTGLYLYTALISFGYYSEEQIQKYVWATLTTWKIVHLPVVERFEYVGIANWCLIILPNACLALWCATRLIKQTYRIPQRIGVYVVGAIALFIIPIFKSREQINLINNLLGSLGFVINFIYIPFLFICVWIVKKVKNKT
ncbi:GerAB/ArcD/ProY family transporter [Heyndrickxia vini]|uniref:GerAB/ArcD/ProY family transporter n=1 Tax=Heyndrickxia vini TaxID=1476025 RepID=A0ABX7E4F4_9BACI|nr:GerAB/ArcD/ProY family transporter [Heyndrickxia vini]QQZ10461.1 GerAB/ArcD/ProY family transporter [Heyndrickxia vini]